MTSWFSAAQKRLIAGGEARKTRFHTYRDELVDRASLPYLPHAVGSALLLKLFSLRVEHPWLGFRGVGALASLLGPSTRVLEFGSGMSSLFFARHCGALVSIENDAAWAREMSRRFVENGFSNIDYRLRSLADYASLDDVPDAWFDLALIDGPERARTLRTALSKVRPGGHVYLDNSDCFPNTRRMLLDAAGREPGDVRIFRDFCPFQIVASEGILARLPPRALEPHRAAQVAPRRTQSSAPPLPPSSEPAAPSPAPAPPLPAAAPALPPLPAPASASGVTCTSPTPRHAVVADATQISTKRAFEGACGENFAIMSKAH
jgi:SAM-dependent methyltransferase